MFKTDENGLPREPVEKYFCYSVILISDILLSLQSDNCFYSYISHKSS